MPTTPPTEAALKAAKEINALFEHHHGTQLSRPELATLIDRETNLPELQRLAKIGEAWETDSSLEKWFPLTAEKLAELERKAAMADELAEALLHAETILAATECSGEKQLGNGQAIDKARETLTRYRKGMK